MRPHSDAFADRVRRSHHRASRLVALDAGLNELAELGGPDGYLLDGSVSQDAGRETRRTCSITIANADGAFTPRDQYSLIYWSKALRVERGIMIDGVPEYVPLGVFIIDQPTVDVNTAGASRLIITGRDRLKIAEKSEFTAPYTAAAGTGIGTLIRALAEAAGMGTSDALYALNDGGKTLVAARTWEQGEGRLRAMLDVANSYSFNLSADAYGRLSLEPDVSDPLSLPAVFDYAPGEASIMAGLSKSWSDERFYNHVLVTGESATMETIYKAEAMDTNPASPGYIYGGIGDRLYKYTSAMIQSTAMAQEVANALLPKVALIEETISMPSVVHPALEANDVIAISEGSSDTDARYQLSRVDIPLGFGQMNVMARRLRSLS